MNKTVSMRRLEKSVHQLFQEKSDPRLVTNFLNDLEKYIDARVNQALESHVETFHPIEND